MAKKKDPVILSDDKTIVKEVSMKKSKTPKKEPKKYSAKKLPKNLKKQYKEKAFQKKVLNKLFIEKDKEFVASYFIKSEDGKKLFVPKDTQIPTPEYKRLVSLSKQIKKQKGRVKWGALGITVLVLAALICVVIMFKDIVLKQAVVFGLQKAFGAKAELSYAHIELLNSSVILKDLQVANKDKPMKNLFQVDTIALDFNLNQLLKARFVSENIEISGMNFNTDRKTSGELPKVAKAIVATTEKKDSNFQSSLAQRTEGLAEKTKNSFSGVFDQYNPASIIDNLESSLQSPKAAEEAKQAINTVVTFWQSKPSELEKSVTSFVQSVKTVTSTDYSKINDVDTLRKALKDIETATSEGKTLKSTMDSTFSKFQSDSNKITAITNSVTTAINADKKLVQTQIDKVSSFTLKDGLSIITDTFDVVALDTLGKYYPYVQQALSYAKSIKKSDSEKVDENTKKGSRLAGRDVYYTKDVYPTLLLERIFCSGPGIEVKAVDISNDADKWGKPAVLTGSLSESNRNHSILATVDARSTSTSPLVVADYTGKGYKIDLSGDKISASLGSDTAINGIPSMNGGGTVGAHITADSDGVFGAKGNFGLNPVKLETASFEPAFASRMYNSALNSITQLSINFDAGYSSEEGISLDISSDADNLLGKALTTAMNTELSLVKKQAQGQIEALLKEKTSSYSESLVQFKNLEGQFGSIKNKLNQSQKELDSKKQEINNRITSIVDKAKQEAVNAAESVIGDSLKKLF